MAPWKLPLIALAIAVPIVAGFAVAGGGGVAVSSVVVFVIVLLAVRAVPRGPIESAPAEDGRRYVLLVSPGAVEDPDDVARIVRAADLGGTGGLAGPAPDPEVVVLVPARIGFLDRWASDVEGARRRAQEHLVATVAALAKAGVAAEARVGDEDVVQAVEDLLQSYPATEVVLIGGDSEELGLAASELEARLEAEFHQVRVAA